MNNFLYTPLALNGKLRYVYNLCAKYA